MPKTKHIATAPNGQIFKRTSENRTYSHVAIARRSKEEALRRANDKLAQQQDGSTWDYYNNNANGKATYSAYVLSGSPEFVAKLKARDIESGQEFITANPDRAAYIARLHAERVASAEGADYTKWYDLGWASRLDLAQKNASSRANRSGYWAEVKIIEAVIV